MTTRITAGGVSAWPFEPRDAEPEREQEGVADLSGE